MELTDYNGVKIVTPEPTGLGGRTIQDNFKTIAEELGTLTSAGNALSNRIYAEEATRGQNDADLQGQINAKAPTADPVFTGRVRLGSGSIDMYANTGAIYCGTVYAGGGGDGIISLNSTTKTLKLMGGSGTYSAADNNVELAQATWANTSGASAAVAILPTYNQTSGTAANTDLLINRTQTAVGSGAQNFIDLQVGGVSKLNITTAGLISAAGGIYGTGMYATVHSTSGPDQPMTFCHRDFSAANSRSVSMATGTYTQTSGNNVAVAIVPTYNQVSSTAANTDLLVNRTQTSVGSGEQRLLACQIGSVDKFVINQNSVYSYIGMTSDTFRAATDTTMTFGNQDITTKAQYVVACTGQMKQTSGSNAAFTVLPTYNQTSSTASNTDLKINRIQTSVGSGTQLLIDAQVGGISKFYVNTGGSVVCSGRVLTTAVSLTQTTTPTSSADATGNVGDIAYDASYFYVKTAGGWKRAALTTF